MVAWEALLPAGEGSLQSTHPPLARLTKRLMHVADSQKVLTDVSMKTSGSPFGDGADERSIRFSALGEALIHTDLVLTNFIFESV